MMKTEAEKHDQALKRIARMKRKAERLAQIAGKVDAGKRLTKREIASLLSGAGLRGVDRG